MKILDLPEEMRPREKALKEGVSSLNDQELLALLLGKGVTGANALELATSLLVTYRNFGVLSSMNSRSFRSFRGISAVKGLQLEAAFEIARRIAKEKEIKANSTPEDLYLRYRLSLGREKDERLVLLCYDRLGTLLEERCLFKGNEVAVAYSEQTILYEALLSGAKSFTLVHNHPSGNCLPSEEDLARSASLKEKASSLLLNFKEHLIIGADAFYSFRQNGLL
jgi:DNA repair protein RadC